MSNTPYELDPDHAAQDDLETQRANEYGRDNPPEPVAENAESDKQAVEESGQVPLQTTADAVKGGEGDYSWGGYEDQKRSPAPAGSKVQKPANVSQEAWDARPEWSRPLEDILHKGSAPALRAPDKGTKSPNPSRVDMVAPVNLSRNPLIAIGVQPGATPSINSISHFSELAVFNSGNR